MLGGENQSTVAAAQSETLFTEPVADVTQAAEPMAAEAVAVVPSVAPSFETDAKK